MDFVLENPRPGIESAKIMRSIGGKCGLYVVWSNMPNRHRPVSDYLFPTDTAAKQYYGKFYQSKRDGFEKPKWKEHKF